LALQLLKKNRLDYLKEFREKKILKCKLKLLENTIPKLKNINVFWKKICNAYKDVGKQTEKQNERLKISLEKNLIKWNSEKDFFLKNLKTYRTNLLNLKEEWLI